LSWVLVALGAWVATAAVIAVVFGRGAWLMKSTHQELPALEPTLAVSLPAASIWPTGRQRILLVDDDPGLRLLLQTTLAADEYAIEEAGSAEEAAELARFWQPALVVLDVNLPGRSGLAFCRELKERSTYGSPHVVLLTGGRTNTEEARAAGADVLLRKPFSPLDVMGAIDSALQDEVLLQASAEAGPDQLLAYARDLRETVQAERAQRRLLQQAYRQTITTLTDALEAKSVATGHHGLRVQRYAVELTEAVAPRLLDDPSLEYGFLLHDIGKIGIPEGILEKRGALESEERRVMQRHPLIGTELLAGVPMLEGEGLQVVRSHHERWDGQGYPDGLRGEEIPPVARIFAVADTLDAMTTDRPYRRRCKWEQAVDEILRESGRQFDPMVVRAFATRAQRLHRTQQELAETA
jgi:response regulator RpfG family c-di-GMP phosphodiesterase